LEISKKATIGLLIFCRDAIFTHEKYDTWYARDTLVTHFFRKNAFREGSETPLSVLFVVAGCCGPLCQEYVIAIFLAKKST
jgi:hypothetical protein